MTNSTPTNGDTVTVLVHHAAPDGYVVPIRERFPGLRVLSAKDQDSLERQLGEADILLAPRFPADLFDKARRLVWFQCSNAGVDTVLAIRDRVGDLIVTNARGVHGEIIADFVMGGMIVMHWDFPRLLQEQSRKEWNPRPIAPLGDHTLGVVGLGSIGATIARRGKSAGMTVIGTKRDASGPVEGVDRVLPPEGLDELLKLSDFVVLAVPQVPDTVGLIGREQLRQMRSSAILINIARGSVVVEDELIEALQAGTIKGAVLDVFEREPLPAESPLWTMPNVFVTPHVSGNPTDYAGRVIEIFADNLQRFLEKKPLRNVVDLKRGY